MRDSVDSLTLLRRLTERVWTRAKQEGNGPKDERATMIMASEVSSDLRIELSDLNYYVI